MSGRTSTAVAQIAATLRLAAAVEALTAELAEGRKWRGRSSRSLAAAYSEHLLPTATPRSKLQ